MDLYAELVSVARALDAVNIPYALCGGLAVGAHGHVRATKDIDLLILPDDLDRASQQLAHVGYIHTGGEFPPHRLTRIEDSDHIAVDLLLVEDPVMRQAWETRVRLVVDDVTLSVVSRDGLVAMKRDSARAIDRDDIERLLENG